MDASRLKVGSKKPGFKGLADAATTQVVTTEFGLAGPAVTLVRLNPPDRVSRTRGPYPSRPLTGPRAARYRIAMRRRAGPSADSFEDFQASVLFCGRCQAARPVRDRLLLVLPDGELHEYLCAACGASVGSRKVTAPVPTVLLAP
jgi:hypothetical protein